MRECHWLGLVLQRPEVLLWGASETGCSRAFPRDWWGTEKGNVPGGDHSRTGEAATTCPCLCPTQVSAVGYGMDEVEQDQHEARLKELFDSFDTTGTGSLGQEELTDLCHMLSLEEVAPVLQQTLLQDNLLGRVRSGEEHGLWEVGCGFCQGAGGGADHTCCNLFLASWLLHDKKKNVMDVASQPSWLG